MDFIEKQLVENFEKYDISTPYFSLQDINTYGRLVDIYDGDTVKIILPVMDGYFKFDVRLNGIDTCEIKSHNVDNKNKAIKARNRICEMIEELWGNYSNSRLETQKDIKDYLKTITCIVFVKCYRFDKYGRLLADVYLDYDTSTSTVSDVVRQGTSTVSDVVRQGTVSKCKSISEILLSEGLAYEYNGKTKLTDEEQNIILKDM